MNHSLAGRIAGRRTANGIPLTIGEIRVYCRNPLEFTIVGIDGVKTGR
jgi:hypothetical protein